MRYELKITSSPKGYYLAVTGKSLYARGSIAQRMDGTTGLTWDGTFLPIGADRVKVESVIADVMADGVDRTVTIGDPEPDSEAVPASWRSSRGLTLTEEMDEEDSDF